FDVTVSPGVGIFSNSGSIRNRGIEATVTGKVLTGPAAAWDVTLSPWGNQNRLVDLGFATYTNLFGWQRATVGYPVGRYWAAAVDPRTPLAEQARAAVPYPTTGYFEDADYLKLREISLSFSPSPKLAAALRARAATITLAGRNLATWTGYSGGDPESGSYGMI